MWDCGRTRQIATRALDGVLPAPLEGGTLSRVCIWALSIGLSNYAPDGTGPIDFIRTLLRNRHHWCLVRHRERGSRILVKVVSWDGWTSQVRCRPQLT